jgi:hypothetical protein
MQKIYIALIAFLVLASVGVCYAASWQSVKTFTGASDTTTDYFSVSTNEWRLTWSYIPSSAGGDYAVFSTFIYPKGETAFYTDFVMKTGRGETSGTTYVHEGIKDYYLKVGSANIQSYSIKIEYDSSAVPEFSSIAIVVAVVLITGIVVIVRKKIKKKN